MHDSMICWLLENVIRPFLIPQWNLWIYFFFERAKMFSFPVVQDIPIWWKIFPDKTSDSRRAEGHNSHVMFQNRLKAKRKGGEVFLKAFKQMSHYRKYFCPLKSLWKTLSWFHLCCHLISPTTQKKKMQECDKFTRLSIFAFSQKEELLQCKFNDYCGSVHSQPASYKSTAKEKNSVQTSLFFASICLSHREN